jgi:hypothetical protein
MLDHDIFPLFGRQVGDGEREGTQAVETDDPALIVDGDENTRHIAFLVLPGTKMEPIIERSQPARECRAVMLAERLDRFDHARSTEKIAMTFQCFDKTHAGEFLYFTQRGSAVHAKALGSHAGRCLPARALLRWSAVALARQSCLLAASTL